MSVSDLPDFLHKVVEKDDIFYTFVTYWFFRCYPARKIKRESGENPEQSRCCKFRSHVSDHTPATVNHLTGRHSKRKQVRRPASMGNRWSPRGLGIDTCIIYNCTVENTGKCRLAYGGIVSCGRNVRDMRFSFEGSGNASCPVFLFENKKATGWLKPVTWQL